MARDWQQLEKWDRAYYLHGLQAASEHNYTPVDSMEGNWFTLADGTRMLDFMSQLISDSMGHRHPAIHAELSRAMERYGHAYFGLANEYRARAAKLIIADLLGDAEWAGRARIFSSGTDAVESCITMARLYTGKSVILTQAHSFHGMVMGSTMMRGYRANLSAHGSFDKVQDIPGFPAQGYIPIPAPEFEDWNGSGRLPSLQATEQIVSAISHHPAGHRVSAPQ